MSAASGNSGNPWLLTAPYERTGSFVIFPVHETVVGFEYT